jgi:adenosylmethionine-8-amino-7-oxononanoate aminotransferase
MTSAMVNNSKSQASVSGGEARASANLAWQQRSARHVWHPCSQMQRAGVAPPLPIARAQGPWLEDYEGRRYFDANSSWWVNLFGHSDAGINAVLRNQLVTLPHVMLAGCTHAPAVELAERLNALTGGVLGHAFYGSDGASAVEIALKMSYHYWRNKGVAGKREFVCLRSGYHGETLGALSVTDVALFRHVYDPLLLHPHLVMSPDSRAARDTETSEDVANRALQEVRALFETRHLDIAAIIIEPLVQCAGGMAMHDAVYLRGLRALCDRFDIHLIADEIAVGCGRTGTFFAFQQAALSGAPAIWPDFLCLSKGITGGYLPLSIVLSRDAIFDAFLDDDVSRGFLHSHSYTGNALACRAALAVLDRFEENNVLRKNQRVGLTLTKALAELAADHRIESFRQCGMIWAFDVRDEFAGPQFAERFHMQGRRHGLLIRPIERTVYLLPPYVLNNELAHWLAERTLETVNDTLSQLDDHRHTAGSEVTLP